MQYVTAPLAAHTQWVPLSLLLSPRTEQVHRCPAETQPPPIELEKSRGQIQSNGSASAVRLLLTDPGKDRHSKVPWLAGDTKHSGDPTPEATLRGYRRVLGHWIIHGKWNSVSVSAKRVMGEKYPTCTYARMHLKCWYQSWKRCWRHCG